MALIKEIRQNNGVILSYHRINDIKHIINDRTYINIYSYINEEEREREKNQTEEERINMPVYIINSIENSNYNDTLTIEQAYEYLKTLQKYEGSKDA